MSYSKEQKKIIVQNRSAFHEYFIEDKVECGIELLGTEVKSLRQGKVNLKEAYAVIEKGECFICGMHISPYEHGNIFNRDPLRKRRLLLH
ncbi:MAG: SsrA-binding protein, partial [Clostridia bacterium]|nr:SsrA-binding protein [Clostridia bacterium]